MKRKRVVLTFREKLEILELLNKGEQSTRELAKQYGIGLSTICEIRKKSGELIEFISNTESINIADKKTRKTAQNLDLETQLYKWYQSKINENITVTGPELCEKALELNKQLNGDPKFKASSGWLKHFKDRHGILDKSEANKSKRAETTEDVIENFQNILKQKQYLHDYVYNINFMNLRWRSLPHDNWPDNIGIVVCTNMTGTHKLPLVILGEKTENSLDYQWYYQHNSNWFDEWFTNIFIPQVNSKQDENNQNERVLLVIPDSLPCYSKKIQAKFKLFPLNEFSNILHPMDYITSLHTIFKTKLLELFLKNQEFSLNKIVPIIVESYDDISSQILIDSWYKLMQFEHESCGDLLENFCKVAHTLKELQEWKIAELKEWLTGDFTGNEFVKAPDNDDDEDGGGGAGGCVGGDVEDNTTNISPTDALTSLDTLTQWYLEQNEEVDQNKLTVLNDLRHFILDKINNFIKIEENCI